MDSLTIFQKEKTSKEKKKLQEPNLAEISVLVGHSCQTRSQSDYKNNNNICDDDDDDDDEDAFCKGPEKVNCFFSQSSRRVLWLKAKLFPDSVIVYENQFFAFTSVIYLLSV